MPWLIVAALIAVPVIEIALFIKSAQWIGIVQTILVAIGAGMLGIYLVKRQGIGTMLRARAMLDRGEVPVAEAFDGLCLAVAGVLLFLPGFATDFVALALLLPPVRAALRLWLGRHVHAVVRSGQPPQPQGPPVIETDYRVVKDDDEPRP
ncbi:MAG TPA: FxsA family protein [Candidatus Omnitrophota bacterium]|nr:FxsA family protein [Candidatus Omnitrophota bacterium]